MFIIKTIIEGKKSQNLEWGMRYTNIKSVPLYQYLQKKTWAAYSFPPSRFYVLNQRVAFLFFQCK